MKIGGHVKRNSIDTLITYQAEGSLENRLRASTALKIATNLQLSEFRIIQMSAPCTPFEDDLGRFFGNHSKTEPVV